MRLPQANNNFPEDKEIRERKIWQYKKFLQVIGLNFSPSLKTNPLKHYALILS
jgi:hypothetical protein